jgi:hypothetical protein
MEDRFYPADDATNELLVDVLNERFVGIATRNIQIVMDKKLRLIS